MPVVLTERVYGVPPPVLTYCQEEEEAAVAGYGLARCDQLLAAVSKVLKTLTQGGTSRR
jgi:hypothetical protein